MIDADIQQAVDRLMEGRDRSAIVRAAQAVSDRYRRTGDSASLSLTSADEAVAYAATRMPATAAAVAHAIAQAGIVPAPKTLLDYGAGPGTATLAALAAWPQVQPALVEPNRYMREIARVFLPQAQWAETIQHADMIIAAYVLNEVADPCALALALWAAAGTHLVLVDTGTPAGSAMMRAVRAALIEAGAHIHAPCPHQLACPFADGRAGWCHFSVRLPRTRLHKEIKGGALGYEDEKFTYLVAARAPAAAAGSRIIGYPRAGKVVDVPLCTPDGTLENASISKRDPRYREARKSRWGDRF